MKKLISLLLLVCFSLEAANVRNDARKRGVKKQKKQTAVVNNNINMLVAGLDLGIDYYHYEEPGVMKIYGPMMSFYGNIGVVKRLFKFQVDGYFSTHLGANTYDGGLQNNQDHTVIPYSTKSTDWYVGVNTKFGLNLWQQNKEIVFAYFGLGYRFLHNLIIDKPGVRGAYDRYQGYLYLPIGINGEIPIKPMISLIGEFEYRFLLFGHNTSGFADLGYDSDLFFTQKKGQGGKLSIGSKFYLNNGSALKLKAYYDYWILDSSNLVDAKRDGQVVGTFVEPKNHTYVFGISLGYVF